MKSYKTYAIRYNIIKELPLELMEQVVVKRYNLLKIKPEFNKIKSIRNRLAIRALRRTKRGRSAINQNKMYGN